MQNNVNFIGLIVEISPIATLLFQPPIMMQTRTSLHFFWYQPSRDSDDFSSGWWNVSQHQQSFSGVISPGRSNFLNVISYSFFNFSTDPSPSMVCGRRCTCEPKRRLGIFWPLHSAWWLHLCWGHEPNSASTCGPRRDKRKIEPAQKLFDWSLWKISRW